jgi:methylmalonyl-CoA/ethylmalonyl-CoA epimerase
MAKLNHLAIVVNNVDNALTFWRDALGLQVRQAERNEGEEVDLAFLPAGDADIELISPINDTSGVAKFLSKHGPGLHHVCIEVEDIRATIQRMKEHKVMLLNDTPKVNDEGTQYCFIHPKSAYGVLVELYEKAK